jgi:hypothetical protein
MEFLKKLFKDDDYIVGLSGFKDKLSPLQTGEGDSVNEQSEFYTVGRGGKQAKYGEFKNPPYNIFTPPKNLVFYTNTKNNFLLK